MASLARAVKIDVPKARMHLDGEWKEGEKMEAWSVSTLLQEERGCIIKKVFS